MWNIYIKIAIDEGTSKCALNPFKFWLLLRFEIETILTNSSVIIKF